MKRIRAFVTAFLVLSLCVCTVSAQENPSVQSTEVIWYEDGSCLEITTIVDTQARASAKSAKKIFDYKVGGKVAISYTLQGWFEYDSSTSKAVDTDASIDIYQPGWSLTSNRETCSGSTVRGTATFSGPSGSKTLSGSITCDKNGNIS
ncbi:hypothetical protein D1159_05385 [Pseudoflavonifractor sp. 524-17]|uniref:hypothetical protein n=1 Tax=Pseudoflavonifractor sp. 524-17 TaxID=2304577 RepID=UPI00137B8FC9|nr:hypothetical protein [Pseudoflavonifractor sp. 524-17]NCE64033.1 hypothetical protein [Pseudoflavonifractor sp. 524-17]